MSSMKIAGELAGKALQLRQAKAQVAGLEQELTDLGYELATDSLGEEPVEYLRSLVVRLLYGRTKGEVSERLLFSALEDAWRAGKFRAEGGVPGPAPGHPGTPEWLYRLSIELEDVLARFPRTFDPAIEERYQTVIASLRALTAEKTNGRNGHGTD